jgi:hypothetical protein
MNVVDVLFDVFKFACGIAAFVCFSWGATVAGYRLSGQGKYIVFADGADQKKASRTGVVLFVVVLAGAVLWATTGGPFGWGR